MNKASSEYVAGAHIREQYGVTPATLRRWDTEGRIRTIRTPGNHRLYNLSDVQTMFGGGSTETVPRISKAKICYARVSSTHQKEDLLRQIVDLQTNYPGYEVVQDIGSGLNYQRKGFMSLLQRVYQGTVETVVVSHKDRLCRYGIELVEWIFKQTGTQLMVLHQDEQQTQGGGTGSPTHELAEDLLAICNYFVAKHNGQRAAEHRRKRQEDHTHEETEAGRIDTTRGGVGNEQQTNEKRRRVDTIAEYFEGARS